MRDKLAETLLARVMGWNPAQVSAERPMLQALADYKYDEYEQYEPGKRFIESLAKWLSQFPSTEQREVAYTFVRERLIYISRPELHHLVGSVYPDLVRPALIRRAAADLEITPFRVAEVERHSALTIRERSTLWVGLSDGARTDVLRRAAPNISHEQVVADYQAIAAKSDDLLVELRADLKPVLGEKAEGAQFTSLVLLDDFSASGISYLREELGKRKGKIAKLARELTAAKGLLGEDLHIHVVVYVATTKAVEHLTGLVSTLGDTLRGTWFVHRMQALPNDVVITRGDLPEFDAIIDEFYDPRINDTHMAKGGADGRYGFADCGLPVVLSHNTPNNSLSLIWHDQQPHAALFPRVSRHRESDETAP